MSFGGTYIFGPVEQFADDTVLVRYGMVAVPQQVLISVSGFLYTVVDRLPSFCGVTRVSKKGIAPSALVFSAVNFMFSSIELVCWKNSLYFASMTTKVSPTKSFP